MVPSSAFVTPGTHLNRITNEAVKIASAIGGPGNNSDL